MEINKIYNENCLDTMARMPDNFADLTVTSPPYDNLRNYNGYNFDFEPTARELYRVTKIGGVVVWVVGDATINGSETGTSFKQALYFKECGFKLHDTIIWHKISPNTPTESRYYNVFEYMFILSKETPKTTNFINDHKNISVGNINNHEKNQRSEKRETTNRKRVTGYYSRRLNVWELQRYSGRIEHPAIFPEKLAADHIHSWSNEGDLIYDPFLGSGTTAKEAIKQNRNWIGSEISSEYCKIAQRRVDNENAKLKLF